MTLPLLAGFRLGRKQNKDEGARRHPVQKPRQTE
jgi:hypothetical protein